MCFWHVEMGESYSGNMTFNLSNSTELFSKSDAMLIPTGFQDLHIQLLVPLYPIGNYADCYSCALIVWVLLLCVCLTALLLYPAEAHLLGQLVNQIQIPEVIQSMLLLSSCI